MTDGGQLSGGTTPAGPGSWASWSADDLEDAQIDLSDFHAVVPAGGAGTRLWPLSRSDRPKFLLDLTGRGRTLLQQTWDRLLPLADADRCSWSPAARTPTPSPRSCRTCPRPTSCASPRGATPPPPSASPPPCWCAATPTPCLGSFAADHNISGRDDFESSVEEAVVTARRGFVVTIGIAPSHPATGFGYIRLGKRLRLQGAPNARRVVQFKEKPDARTASAYLSTGDYRWNGGMFVTRADVLLELLATHAPALHAGLQRIADAWETPQREAVLEEQWSALPAIAIDHAVPTRRRGGPRRRRARDLRLGRRRDFSSLAELLPADVTSPRSSATPTSSSPRAWPGGSFVPGNGRVVAARVDDLVVVDTPDALMVTTRARRRRSRSSSSGARGGLDVV